jgi:cytochrome oxidase Cu insertion factor (SCO1/SenC/PrrC family)
VRVVSATPPTVPAPRPAFPLRWIVWGVVLFVGLAAGIGLLTLGSATHASAPAVSVSDTPAGTWAAGKLRAPDFRLTDQHGAPVTLAALRGRPVIVTFIDPLCRDFCPLEAKRLNAVAQSFPAAAKPAIVAVSVNVRGNTRESLMQDVDKWSLVPQWRWGVGTEAQLASVWKRYHIGVLVTTKKIAGVTAYYIAHTEAAYVIDARGYQRAVFLWPYRAEAVTRTLRGLTPAS